MQTSEPVRFRPIGWIRTPFADLEASPIEPGQALGAQGRVELDPSMAEGLQDIEGFSHLILIWHQHLTTRAALTVTPYLDDRPHGIFATRAPARPNAIGLSVVQLLAVEGHTLHVRHLDMADGTPLLDIKPYVPAFDDRAGARIGWYARRIEASEPAGGGAVSAATEPAGR